MGHGDGGVTAYLLLLLIRLELRTRYDADQNHSGYANGEHSSLDFVLPRPPG